MRKLSDHDPVPVTCPRCGAVNGELRVSLVPSPRAARVEPLADTELTCPYCGGAYAVLARVLPASPASVPVIYTEI